MKKQTGEVHKRADLAVLNEPEDVFKAVVVEEDGLEDWSVGALQDLGDGGWNRQGRKLFTSRRGNPSFELLRRSLKDIVC